MKKNILLVGILVTLTAVSYAQLTAEQHKLSNEKKEKIADKLMMEGSYYGAVDVYKEIWQTDTSRYDLKYKMGLAYYFSRDYIDAEPWFAKAVKLDPKAPTLAYYYYGESLRHNQKYELAKEQYRAFKKVKYRGSDAKEKSSLSTQHIKSCDYALQNIKNPVFIKIENLGDGVNSNYSDFSPLRVDDSTLIYASLRSDTVIHIKPGTTDFYPVQLYKTKKTAGEWSKPELYGDILNKHYAHSANPYMTPDGKTIYFTWCKPFHNEVRCDIYEAQWEVGTWSHPKKLHDKINNPKYTSTQPTFGFVERKKGKTVNVIPVLYFVSNKPGGKGGLDIWYAELGENGHFSRPKNAGKINTDGDEVSPYYHNPTKELYFSSNYHENFGGFDIFKVAGETKNWQKPMNIGYRLNSALDDTYFVLDSTNKHGFLVSNRPGGHALTSETCCDDIYEFNYNEVPKFILDAFAYDKNDPSQNPLSAVKISLFTKDKSGNDSLVYSTKDASKFNYEITANKDYTLKAENDDYESTPVAFNTTDMFDIDTLAQKIPMWKKEKPVEEVVVVKEEVIEEEKPKYVPGFVLKVVYHEFDKAEHSKNTDNNILDVIQLMKANPWMRIAIESHTDSKGTDEYNNLLSKRRSESCKTYMIRNGISGSRIEARYYGESKPVAPNEKSDGTDNPEGRDLNRRTEFVIISNTPSK